LKYKRRIVFERVQYDIAAVEFRKVASPLYKVMVPPTGLYRIVD
jgi:hypothetical protein